MAKQVKMKNELATRYRERLPGEMEALSKSEKVKLVTFLASIEGQIIDIVFTAGDAFEKQDDNYWLPDELWEEV